MSGPSIKKDPGNLDGPRSSVWHGHLHPGAQEQILWSHHIRLYQSSSGPGVKQAGCLVISYGHLAQMLLLDIVRLQADRCNLMSPPSPRLCHWLQV
ncbi:hypothetical protein FKM82_024732 [Ascaphus truei]